MLSALLLPLQVVVILVLHTCFALSRLVTLLRQLPLLARAQAERAAASTAQIDEDRLRWKKTPRRLAVSFATGRQWSLSGWTSSSSSGSERKRRGEEREVRKVVEDVRRLVTWCDQLGMEELSLYDEQGLLERHASTIVNALSSSVTLLRPLEQSPAGYSSFKIAATPRRRAAVPAGVKDTSPSRAEIDSGCGISDSGADGAASPPSSTLLVHFLTRRAGRPHLARVAQELAYEFRQGLYGDTGEELTPAVVEEKVEAGRFAEPDLLLVLGGPYLRLKGFPPWEVRLTELYHHPSPEWLPTPILTWSIMRRALDLYGGAQMRLGR